MVAERPPDAAALVPPGQVLKASDAPYGRRRGARPSALRHALQVGLDHDQVRGVMGAQAARLLAREDPLELGSAPGPGRLSRDLLLDRVYAFLLSALGQMFNGVEPAETLSLVRLACDMGDDAPQAPVCHAVLELLDERDRIRPKETAGLDASRGLHFVIAAASLARAPRRPRLTAVLRSAARVALDRGSPEPPARIFRDAGRKRLTRSIAEHEHLESHGRMEGDLAVVGDHRPARELLRRP